MDLILLAQSGAGTIATKAAIWLVLLAILSLLVVAPWLAVRAMRRAKAFGPRGPAVMGSKRERCYTLARERFELWMLEHPTGDAGPEVELVFHTYTGFLVHGAIWEHREKLPSVLARQLLRELHVFNLTHGAFTHGALFVPFMSWWDYRKQLRRIGRVERAVGAA